VCFHFVLKFVKFYLWKFHIIRTIFWCFCWSLDLIILRFNHTEYLVFILLSVSSHRSQINVIKPEFHFVVNRNKSIINFGLEFFELFLFLFVVFKLLILGNIWHANTNQKLIQVTKLKWLIDVFGYELKLSNCFNKWLHEIDSFRSIIFVNRIFI